MPAVRLRIYFSAPFNKDGSSCGDQVIYALRLPLTPGFFRLSGNGEREKGIVHSENKILFLLLIAFFL